MCFMEAGAYYSDRPFTDHDETVCPAIGAFARRWNDGCNDETRQLLKPYVLKVIGTNDGKEDERSCMIIDWVIRYALPRYLDLYKSEEKFRVCAEGLRGLSQINVSSWRAELDKATPFLKSALDLALARDLDLALARDLALALARDLDLALARDLDLASAEASPSASEVEQVKAEILQSRFALFDQLIELGAGDRIKA